jgi:hypothetical protein
MRKGGEGEGRENRRRDNQDIQPSRFPHHHQVLDGTCHSDHPHPTPLPSGLYAWVGKFYLK